VRADSETLRGVLRARGLRVTEPRVAVLSYLASTDRHPTAEEVETERARALAYCGGDGSEIHWDFIRALFVSVADTAIVPLQDVLGAGGEARMNLPGRPGGNWRWRFAASDLDPGTRKRLAAITDGSGRRPRPGD